MLGANISGDGRYVAFTSLGSSWVANPGFKAVLYVHDRTEQRLSVISLFPDRSLASGFNPRFSSDGQLVFFDTSDRLTADDRNVWSDVYVHDRERGTTDRISRLTSPDPNGAGNEPGDPDQSSTLAEVSADGRLVAYRSRASNLTVDPNGSVADLFVRDRASNRTLLVNQTANGGYTQEGVAQVNDLYGSIALSADGRFVAFPSASSSYVNPDTNAATDFFVRSLNWDWTLYTAP